MAKAVLMRPLGTPRVVQTMGSKDVNAQLNARSENNDSSNARCRSEPGLRKSATCWKLSDLAALATDEDEPSNNDMPGASDSVLQKPPRHSNVPMYAQLIMKLWQDVLKRDDVGLSSDFFDDLNGDDSQALEVVDRMQQMGFNIAPAQFFALDRCSIYSVLLIAL